MTSASAPCNIGAMLRENAARHPARRALSFPVDGGWLHVDYRTIDADSDACAHAFGDRIRQGTRVALLVKPGPELFTLLFALFKVGAVPVVVDPGMGLSRILRAFAHVGVEAFIGMPLAHLVRRVRPAAFASVHTRITVHAGAHQRAHADTGDVAVGASGEVDGATYEDLILRGRASGPFPIAATTADDALLLSFTTGSTGPAKPTVITHGGARAMVQALVDMLGPDDGDVTFVTMPVMAVMDLLAGCSAVLAPMDPSAPARADGAVIAAAIDEVGARHMFASPALLQQLVKHGQSLRSLRSVVSGGAPVSASLVAALRALLPANARLETTYGATEALPITTIESADILSTTAQRTAAGEGTCVGRPVNGVDVKLIEVVDGPIAGDGVDVARGAVGEIVVRGALVSPRYHASPAADARHKLPGGWHRTGDLGRFDDGGRVWFAGRMTHRVRTVDRELLSVQVEGVLNAHADVHRTALVGVGPAGKQRPVVCVELKHGVRDSARVERELKELAARHAVTTGLTTFLFHPSFPVDLRHNAKIKREELAAFAGLALEPPSVSVVELAVRAVPVLGWVYILVGIVVALPPPARALWSVIVFTSVVVHALQLIAALPVGRRAGHSDVRTVVMTFLLGATWWKPLQKRLTP